MLHLHINYTTITKYESEVIQTRPETKEIQDYRILEASVATADRWPFGR
jgi:hypothetical protein